MFPSGCSCFCVLLTLCLSACGLETLRYNGQEVICSQVLSKCSVKDEMLLTAESTDLIKSLKPHFKLCCKEGEACALCLVINVELHLHPGRDNVDDGPSGADDEDPTDEDPRASVTVCYSTAATVPTCKKVEFTVNHTLFPQHNQAKISLVVTKVDGFPFSSQVFVYPAKNIENHQEVVAPSLDEVCSQELQQHVPLCQVPLVRSVINQEKSQVELQFKDRKENLPSMCLQYEENGSCQSWNRTTIPMYYVTPCLCLQVWDEENQGRRLKFCPFNKIESQVSQKNLWDNISVSLRHGKMNNLGTMLSWNLSAPCRLEGEVWSCAAKSSCRLINTSRQQISNSTWRQNSKGLWELLGVFENIDPEFLPCVMVRVEGLGHKLGPFCVHNTRRSHWILLVIGVVMLGCLAGILFYFLRDVVKKWVWRGHRRSFVKVGQKGHVVLLSPPDEDEDVSESVCKLGSLLCSRGFSVSVDQWSRKEQCVLGPLPWLHSQLLKLDSQGGRVVLVLTQKALEKTEEWTQRSPEAIMSKGDDQVLPQLWSPYSDTYKASLLLVKADKMLGRAARRFLLVTFDSQPAKRHSVNTSLPEPLQGLPLFRLPSQTQALLTELLVTEKERLPRNIKTMRSVSDGWRAKTRDQPERQKASCQYLGVGNNMETKPLNYP